MNPTLRSTKTRTIARGLVTAVICLIIALQAPGVPAALAQGSPPGNWSQPLNISNAGSSSDPNIVVDATGTAHVIWYDQFAGYRYVRSDAEAESGWSEPVTMVFPFQQYRPRLLREGEDMIRAFWRNEENNLYAARVRDRDFGNRIMWTDARPIAQSTLAYDVITDSTGVAHMIFLNMIETETMQSGLYYRQSFPGQNGWSDPRLIYPSLYLRGVAEEDINIAIAVEVIDEENSVIYAAWDESPLSKVFYSRSFDEGRTWESPVEVDATAEGAASALPFGVDLMTWNEQVLMLWKRGNPESSCTLHYQATEDQGETWTLQGSVTAAIPGCANELHFMSSGSDALYLQATSSNQVYMLAWDGSRWSDEQRQASLSSTIDPVTGRPLQLGCWKVGLSPELGQFIAVGCDLDGTQDIWLATRPLEGLENWFPPESSWTRPVAIYDQPAAIRRLRLLTDGQGGLHSLWVQEHSAAPIGPDGLQVINDAVYYANWDGSAWSPPVAVLQAARGKISHFSVSMTPDGILYAMWQGDQTGEMYFSWANATRAYIPAEWAQPVTLPQPEAASQMPEIAAMRGFLYATYTVPVNESRGIYMTRSIDGGKTWGEPELVFDGQAAEWEMVGESSVAVGYDGSLHVTWRQETLPGTRGTLGLYYARSADGGQTWSAEDAVVEGNILWDRLLISPTGAVYVIWQQANEANIIRGRVSQDSGASWDNLESLALSDTPTGPAATFFDPAGNLHVLQFVQDRSMNITLSDWEYAGESWAASQHQNPEQDPETLVVNLAGVVSETGVFSVVYTTEPVDPTGTTAQNVFFTTSRSVTLPETLPTPPEPPSGTGPQAVQPTQAPPTPAPTLTAAPTIPIDTGGPSPAGGEYTGLILSIGLSGLVVVVGFVVLLSRSRQR